jgi:predicted lipoprotein with Yx(FWY)xxD motif
VTSTSLSYNKPVDKSYAKGSPEIRTFSLDRSGVALFVVLDKPGRGGKRLGKYRRVTEVFLTDDRMFAGFIWTDRRSGTSNCYVQCAKAKAPEEMI